MRTSLLVTLALASCFAHGAELYRSVAEDGTVTYSDRPPTNDAEVMRIATQRASSRASAAAPSNAGNAGVSAASQMAAEDDERTLQELRDQKAQNCADSQLQLAHITSIDQLYRSLADGAMEPLNPTEIAEARARAEAEVEEWCD